MFKKSIALLLGLTLGAVTALKGEPSGGIVPTENNPVDIAPGPEPDVTFFATGECIGKIEPCG